MGTAVGGIKKTTAVTIKLTAKEARKIYKEGGVIKNNLDETYWLSSTISCMSFGETPKEVRENNIPPFDLFNEWSTSVLGVD